MQPPFYDPNLSYQQNYDLGPFGLFLEEPSAEEQVELDLPEQEWAEVAGLRLRRRIGIPAGPLLNSKFTDAAFKWGYDLCHYKTVRSREWPSHDSPNVLYVHATSPIEPYLIGQNKLVARPFADGEIVDLQHLSITNSFGMPAQPPAHWQADMERAARGAGAGQALIGSVTGTLEEGGDADDLVKDHARAAAMCTEAGAHAVEVNLSCPNLGGHGLMCHDPEASARVCQAARKAIGELPLFAKLGNYMPSPAGEETLRRVVEATAPWVQGYGAVNAVPVPVITQDGSRALSGEDRALAGVCGAALRATGLDVVARLANIRHEKGYSFAIIGVGGLLTPENYREYIQAGADAVQGATGPMWNVRLAVEIARVLKAKEKQVSMAR
ncbi:MAG: diguanylate cyclase [Chloroflexota bacterium]|nr:diguanylate cyclase [Chloroflexota bacterium]